MLQVENHGTCNDDIVAQLASQGSAARQRQIRDTSNSLRNLASVRLGEFGKGCAAGGDASSRKCAVSGASSTAFHLDGRSDSQRRGSLAGSHGQSGKRLNLEVGAAWAALDERRGEGEDRLGAQRGIKGIRNSLLASQHPDSALVSRLNRGNGRGRAQDGLVLDQRRSTQVGGHADILEHRRRGDHGFGIGKVELVLASLDGFDAALRKSRLQQYDVFLFRLANGLEVR